MMVLAGSSLAALPHWATTMPDPALKPTAGLQALAANHTTVYRAGAEWGAYNHGPIISQHDGTYVLSWYKGVMDESVENREALVP